MFSIFIAVSMSFLAENNAICEISISYPHFIKSSKFDSLVEEIIGLSNSLEAFFDSFISIVISE